MAERTCHHCVYARVDSEQWLRCRTRPELLLVKCANHPFWPGRLREVPGGGCPNFRPKPAEPAGDVKRIPLGDGRYALVDAADYEHLSQYTWYLANDYAARRENGKIVLMHAQIMKPPKGMMVDHANHSKLDNTRANLRICTRQENMWNARKHSDAASVFKGVGLRKRDQRWYARIYVEGRQVWLGFFTEEAEAARAYDRAAVEHFGEFACVNFPEEWPPDRRAQIHAQHAEKQGGKGENVRTP